MAITRVLLILLLLVSSSAGARMYQWRNQDTGSVQFAGVPPAWYRSPQGGPRVLVYDGGKLVDDTSIKLEPEEDKELRDLAFRDLEQRQQQDAIKRLERAARREVARREEERQAIQSSQRSDQAAATEAPPEVLPESLDAAMVNRLKSIIADYDHAQGTPLPSIGQPARATPQLPTTDY
jgi:hypothetical protein